MARAPFTCSQMALKAAGSRAAMSARTAGDDAVTGIWQAMAEVCDHACKLLTELKSRWPQCGVSHDRILDIRNRCQRLAEWHS